MPQSADFLCMYVERLRTYLIPNISEHQGTCFLNFPCAYFNSFVCSAYHVYIMKPRALRSLGSQNSLCMYIRTKVVHIFVVVEVIHTYTVCRLYKEMVMSLKKSSSEMYFLKKNYTSILIFNIIVLTPSHMFLICFSSSRYHHKQPESLFHMTMMAFKIYNIYQEMAMGRKILAIMCCNRIFIYVFFRNL